MGAKPIILELEKNLPTKKAESMEKKAIKHFKKILGDDILNISQGGLLPPVLKGKKHPNFGKKVSSETIEKIRNGNKGKTMSAESRQKISKSGKGRLFSREHRRKISKSKMGNKNHKSRTVQQFDMNENLIETYGSIAEAERNTRLNKTDIRRTCIGERKSFGGYIWRYKENE